MPRDVIAHGSLTHLEREAPLAREFWRWLGFRYAAVDIDDLADSIPLDLNFDGVLDEMLGTFQLVTNYGTTEHIVNQFNAFKVIHDLTATNGLMIHSVPWLGMPNHGLFNYNVKFFWMLCRANDYKVVVASMSGSGQTYPMPDNIIELMVPFDSKAEEKAAEFTFADANLTFVLQKVVERPFLPPVDLPEGVLGRRLNNKTCSGSLS